MNRLCTLAYPALNVRDRAFVEDLRLRLDARFAPLVAPHFTLVFGCAAVAQPEYLRHAQAVADDAGMIRFRCRYALLGADDEDATAYVFLVPDEGFAQLSLLHDLLYTGPLAKHLRLDLPYIPHITIGRLGSRTEAKQVCDELNYRGVDIAGTIEALSVVAHHEGTFTHRATYELQGATRTGRVR